MAASRQTRAKRYGKKIVNNESSDSSTKAQKSFDVSIFDFNEPESEEFDVKSTRKNFRKRRNEETGPKNKHQASSFTNSKNEATAKKKESNKKSRKRRGCEITTLDLDKKLFVAVVNDNNEESKEHVPITGTEIVSHQTNKRTFETQSEDNEFNNQETSYQESIIEKSIKRLEKFKGRSKQNNSCVNADDRMENTNSCGTATSSEVAKVTKPMNSCPVCLDAFAASLSDSEIAIHVNSCLDLLNKKQEKSGLVDCSKLAMDKSSSATNEQKHRTDEDLAKELQERENAKVIEERLSNNLFFCGICQKDLNRLSAESRQVHINRCADFSEKENAMMRRAQRKSLKDNSKEFECLICGEMFSSRHQKVAHVKKCWKQNNVDGRELLQLVREVSSSNASLASAQVVDNHLENSAKTINDLLKSNTSQSKLESRRGKKVKRKKTSNEEIPVLLTRSEEEAQKMAISKATEIIEEQVCIKSDKKTKDTICLPESKVADKYKRKINNTHETSDKQINDSNKATSSELFKKNDVIKAALSLWEFSDIRTSLLEAPKFYVPDMFEEDLQRTIEQLKKTKGAVDANSQGSPKMDNSVNATHTLSTAHCDDMKNSNTPRLIKESAFSKPKVDFAVEQSKKVAVVDGFEALNDVKKKTIDVENETGNNEKCSGFLQTASNENYSSGLKEKLDRIASKAKASLISSLELLLNDEESKDVSLLCANGKIHKAHGCILFMRCPKLKKGGNTVELTRFKDSTVVAVLKFIYTGAIDTEMENPDEVYELANWLSLDALAEASVALLNKHEANVEPLSTDSGMVKINVEDLEKTLWHKDTGEEEEESSQMGFCDYDSPFDQSDEEDLRYFIATQRDRCDSSGHSDDEKGTNYQSKETIVDKNLKDDSAEDGEFCLSHKEDGFASLTGCNEKLNSEPCQYMAISVSPNAIEVNMGTHQEGLELMELDSLTCSSGGTCDEDCASLEGAQLGSLHTVSGEGKDYATKYKSDSNDVDRIVVDDVDSVPKDVVECGQKCDRIVLDFPESCSDTRKVTTDVIDFGENADQKTFGSKIVNGTGIQLNRQNGSIEIADCDNATTGLQIVDLRSPNLVIDSDEEDLFNSSGGLDMAICLDNNEDHNALTEDQIDEQERQSKIQRQTSNVTLETPDIVTPKPFEKTLATPNMFSSDQHSPVSNTFHQPIPSRVRESDFDVVNCVYDNNENNDKYDTSDAYSDRCDSDSVELHNDSAATKSTLKHNDPVSPCVTTSQYERKSSSEGTHYFERSASVSTARSLPSINQTAVICLDDDETSDDEGDGCTTFTRGVNVENSAVRPLKSSCRDDSARRRYWNDTPATGYSFAEAIRTQETDSMTPVRVPTDETDVINERGERFLSGHGQYVNQCLAGNEEFSTLEIPKKDENREHSFEEFTAVTPEDMNLSKERFCNLDDKSSDEIIEVNRPNNSAEHREAFDNESVDSTQKISTNSEDIGENDSLIEMEVSSSSILQGSSPEFLPPSCDKRKRYTKNRSPGSSSLKRKVLFDRGSSLYYNECDDTSNADGKSEDQLPARKTNLTTMTAKISPSKRRPCGLNNKSSCTLMLDERNSQDYNKITPSPSRCSHHETVKSDSSSGSESPNGQTNAEDDDGCRVLSYHSFADSFDDGGFNPDIHCEGPELKNCTFDESSITAINRKENDEDDNENEKLRRKENVVEIDSENDMFDLSDNCDFDGDIMQDLSPINDGVTTTKYSSGVYDIMDTRRPRCVSKAKENLELSTISENRLGHTCDDLNELEPRSVLLDNIDSPAICKDDSYIGAGVENSGTDVSKTIVGRRKEKQSDKQATRNKAPTGNHIMTTETPCSTVKAFGPGCGVHPESGIAITPMSDYEALQTPVLIKRVKQYGLRKLPKHQMAGKLREIYKIQHGFTSWEEPPTKAKRKKKGKETTYDKRENTDSNAVVLVQDSGGNHDSETSSDGERQKTFEGSYSDDESSSQASSQVDQIAETLSRRLMKFFMQRKELYERILTYQKINFEEMYHLVKESKIKCSKSQLTNFLDEQADDVLNVKEAT